MLKKLKITVLSLMVSAMWSVNAFATKNSKMVWENPSEEISTSVTGQMAKNVALVIIVVSALGWAITADSSIMGKIIRIIITLAIVGGAGILLGVFNITGGVMIGF